MIRKKITSLTLATVAGISLLSSNADAQGWRNAWGWGQQTSHGSSCSANTLRSDVYAADRLSNQMVYQFSREMNSRCSCSLTLLKDLKINASLSRNLVTAFNGDCKCAFKKAACALNTNSAKVAKQSRKVHSLSCMLKGNISETVSLAKRIHKNADQFTPRTTNYTNRRPAPDYSRGNNDRFANSNRDRNRNRNNNTYVNNDSREGLAALLRSLLAGRTVPTSETIRPNRPNRPVVDNHDDDHHDHSGHGHDDHGHDDHHGHNH